QLVGGQTHGFTSRLNVDALHFKDDGTGANFGDKELGVTFAATHLDVLWLTRHRRVRKYPDPNLAAAFDVAGHGLPRRLDLTRGYALLALGLQRIITKGDVI